MQVMVGRDRRARRNAQRGRLAIGAYQQSPVEVERLIAGSGQT